MRLALCLLKGPTVRRKTGENPSFVQSLLIFGYILLVLLVAGLAKADVALTPVNPDDGESELILGTEKGATSSRLLLLQK